MRVNTRKVVIVAYNQRWSNWKNLGQCRRGYFFPSAYTEVCTPAAQK